MAKLLNLTIKINSETKYKEGFEPLTYPGAPPTQLRDIEPTSLEIKDQAGGNITELNNNSSFASKFQVSDIKNIRINFSSLDIPISWSWENKGADTEIEFTLKKLKYDETKGLGFGNSEPFAPGTASVSDTLFLAIEDFEIETFESKSGEKFLVSQIIELSDKYPNIKKTFDDFRDLKWKITKAEEEEQIARFVPEIEKYQNAVPSSLEHKFYHLKNINNNLEEVKEICQKFLKKIQDLTEWKKVGIKTLADVSIAEENGFDIIADPSLKSQISSEGKYKGFYITSPEKHKTALISFGNPSIIIKKRYTKDNIDMFRNFFTNDLDQSDPKYFRGFRPGDIKHLANGKFVSVNHQVDIRDKTDNQWEIKKNEDFTRTYYEIKTHEKQGPPSFNEFLKVILQTSDLIGKTKKEILDINFKQWWENYDKNRYSQTLYKDLTDLFWVLDKNFVGESRENCETASNTLKIYENIPEKQWLKKEIKNRYSSEIATKKNEVTDRIKVLFQETIDAAANEDYGFGPLSTERKRIFTTYRSQLGTLSILAEIRELIKSLVKAEKFIAEFKNLDKMVSLKKLEEEYQNGSGDKKTAYTIVNQVDDQWVDRTITELRIIKKKDPQILLAESRTRLKLKYTNDVVAQAIFDNEILDSAAALQEAEKLLKKVREAETKNDVDVSLLTLLQGYQEAATGTFKNKAWQAVNSHNQQAETVLAHLQKTDQSREEVAKTLQEAKNESELEAAYNRAKDSELYKQGGQSKKVIRNLRRRKLVSFQLDQESFSSENKIFLQNALLKLIPETIKNDNVEKELTELENQLKAFQTSSENEEKGQIYQKYKKTIDQVLSEIRQEKQRYQQTKIQESSGEQTPKDDTQNSDSSGRLPNWAWGLIIIVTVSVIGTVFLYSILHFYQRRGRRTVKNLK